MDANTPNYKPILPEAFDVRFLRRLAREGRLYYDDRESTDESIAEERRQEVLQYVVAIDDYASPLYKPFITRIWHTIIDDPALNQQLLITKGRHQGKVNCYRVLAIVTVLLETGVYDQSHTLLALHHRLQNTTHKDSVYTSRLNYALTHSQHVHLRHLIKNILDNSGA